MINIDKALDVLGLPPEFEAYNGQINTRITYGFVVLENNDFSTGKNVITYTVEKTSNTQLFGLYPLNYASMALYNMGFQILGTTPKGYQLQCPAKWVKHEAPSGLAGQTIYYVESNMYFNPDRIDLTHEPYETVVGGVAQDMKDPLVRVQYRSRIISKDASGKTIVKWTSRGAITPKRRLRKAEFLKLANVNEQEMIWQCRSVFVITPVKGETHITSIAMDIEKLNDTQVKSTVYINGIDANTFNYKSLINSFGQTYGGYKQMYRLYNGDRTTPTSMNVYGSTIDIGLNPTEDSTLNLRAGGENVYDVNNQTLTFNPSLVDEAKLLAYMEFLPANGKNENTGKWLSLETNEESFY